MDKKAHSTTNTVFNRLGKAKHLTPLSRMITFEQKDSLDHQRKLSNPLMNFKIEIANNFAKKRKLEDSSPADGCETPAKKAWNPKDLSPDLGCFMDYCSPPARQDSMSPSAIVLNKTQAVRSEIKESVSSQLHSEHVECGSSTETGVNKGTAAHSLSCEKILLNLAPAFDCDVDDILCLNPVDQKNTAVGFSDNVESCKSPSSNTFQNKLVINPNVAHVQKMERGDGQVKEGREEWEREMYLNVNDVEEDKGYFSASYLKGLKKEKNPSPSVYSQLPPATSRSLLTVDEVEISEECHPECSSESGCQKQAELSGQQVSFTVSDLCPIVCGPLLNPQNTPVEPLEGDVEEAWNIGSPVLESSICQTTLGEVETSLDTTYETTLPLQVQVKSVVVVPNQHAFSKKTAPPPLPVRTAKPTKLSSDENRRYRSTKCVSARNRRPVIFAREAEWDRERRLFVQAVIRHVNEHRVAGQDVVTELQTLMTHVADKAPGSDCRQWQHPSDFTRRNYRRQFGKRMPKVTLDEWQAKNCKTHKRFARVPKFF